MPIFSSQPHNFMGKDDLFDGHFVHHVDITVKGAHIHTKLLFHSMSLYLHKVDRNHKS